jgi:uncharacterized integral membrane protein
VRIFYRAGLVVIAIFLILFAVSNRDTAPVALWPLPFLVEVPLYMLSFLSLAIGALIGVAIAWMAGRRKRRKLKSRGRRIGALERELMATQSQLKDQSVPARGQLPVTRQLPPLVREKA